MMQSILLHDLMLQHGMFLFPISVKTKKNEEEINVVEGFPFQFDASVFVILSNRLDTRLVYTVFMYFKREKEVNLTIKLTTIQKRWNTGRSENICFEHH